MFKAAWRHAATPATLRVCGSAVKPANFFFGARNFTVSGSKAASLFGEVTQGSTTPEPSTTDGEKDSSTPESPKDDLKLQQYYLEEAKKTHVTRDKFISPLKRQLFDLNVAKHGFFKNGHVVTDNETGKTYQLTLTAEEIEILEPSLYISSSRIKSSTKKATLVNRFVRGLDVTTAINQLHFNPKKMATELERLLKQGLEQCRKAGYDEDGLYIQALWTGSDGEWVKRPDIKGRGRTGIIEHPYVHLRAILRTKQTKQRIAWEKQQALLAAKPRSYLNNAPLNFSVRGLYKW
ncbi:ribosomal protein L22 [Metschnikowia bicuspidata var. bicuspidata NRRL YB-4993]|uniref:Ribosomal protein L22 n=1 Tax=Metschnikowia bicuspidata var. bicuspidata NRRL YB-4993 TaxID=869754 RepID=A0A1A0HFA6_9ASCO|nr:ribosomal protein L22 [Metschnikowia bicuspidata var. bicuspidata NRRL YB-4993]OBA22568.1 ribosomal protein L22 [Metschnikowia bicuspidata var. bicuspidata NRRL YB-4993]